MSDSTICHFKTLPPQIVYLIERYCEFESRGQLILTSCSGLFSYTQSMFSLARKIVSGDKLPELPISAEHMEDVVNIAHYTDRWWHINKYHGALLRAAVESNHFDCVQQLLLEEPVDILQPWFRDLLRSCLNEPSRRNDHNGRRTRGSRHHREPNRRTKEAVLDALRTYESEMKEWMTYFRQMRDHQSDSNNPWYTMEWDVRYRAATFRSPYLFLVAFRIKNAMKLLVEQSSIQLDIAPLANSRDPDEVGRGLKLVGLDLGSQCLHSRQLYRDARQLDYLYYNHFQITYVGKSLFRGFKNLIKLDLGFNAIPTLEDFVFHDLNKLEKLVLSNNVIQEISPNAFYGLENLVELNLSKNLLRSLSNNTFVPLKKLRHLYLHHNTIARIETQAFRGLADLRSITLHHNRIHHLRDRVFSDLANLKKLDLSFNPLEQIYGDSLQGMTRLHTLKMTNTSICQLPIKVFRSLHKLDSLNISMGRLVNIHCGTLEGLSHLKRIDLSGNEISMLPNGAFKHLQRVRKINLERNAIVSIDPFAFGELESLEYLELTHSSAALYDWRVFLPLKKTLRKLIAQEKTRDLDLQLREKFAEFSFEEWNDKNSSVR